jgi:hypothetical protein
MGLIPMTADNPHALIGRLLAGVTGDNGYTLDLKADTMQIGKIDKSGTMLKFVSGNLPYYMLNVVKTEFQANGQAFPVDVGFSGSMIMDTGTSGILCSKLKKVASAPGVFRVTLEQGVVLSASIIPDLVEDDFQEGAPSLMGICGMIDHVWGIDLANWCVYLK